MGRFPSLPSNSGEVHHNPHDLVGNSLEDGPPNHRGIGQVDLTGQPGDRPTLRLIQAEVHGEVPVFLNTGARADNIADFLEVADGVIVGSGLKLDGNTWNAVDPVRVRSFISVVQTVRGQPASVPASRA